MPFRRLAALFFYLMASTALRLLYDLGAQYTWNHASERPGRSERPQAEEQEKIP